MKSAKKILFSLLAVLMLPGFSFGQDQGASGLSQDFVVMAILLVLALTIIVLIAVVYVLSSLRNSIKEEEVAKKKEAGIVVEEKPGWWSVLMTKMTDTVPVEKEETVLLDHNYDGIRELDNHLPPWWTYLFYLTIVFGAIYLLNYHVFKWSPLSDEEYQMEVAEAEAVAAARRASLAETQETIDESNIEFSDDPTHLTSGKQIFNRQCASCHREDGGGGIGPNLTDEYWLHGGSMNNIYMTIKNGVPEKGMISWEPLLSPVQMRDVSSYIVTLKGSNPENAKAPQGEVYVEETDTETKESAGEDSTPEDNTTEEAESTATTTP